jgi:chorismate mutase/prephenate dehydratase
MSDSEQSQTAEQKELAVLRESIDGIDKKIGELISERAQCALEVAQVKQRYHDGKEELNFYRPEREAQVLRQIMERNKGPLKDEELARLFREIMSACLALEKPVHVAYLGPEGTFTQQAALKHFGHSAVAVPLPAIDDVFREVAAGAANFGVVPIENSTEGVVTHTIDNFINNEIKICGEVVLRIHHNLLVADATRTSNISRIYSHAQSLAQCRKWIDSHYPQAERVAVSSNSEAARRVKSEWHSAAIAGSIAGEIYELQSFAENIEDEPHNSTRFLIIGPDDVPASGDDKTSVVVSIQNQPGALHGFIEPFHKNGVDMTRLESRPSRSGLWDYVFFIDFKGHQSDEIVAQTLKEVGEKVSSLRVLGSYPRGVL